jgi:hypothetical protein
MCGTCSVHDGDQLLDLGIDGRRIGLKWLGCREHCNEP